MPVRGHPVDEVLEITVETEAKAEESTLDSGESDLDNNYTQLNTVRVQGYVSAP